MARLGPFEGRAHLAVAVSGGPDSVALMRLLAAWCRDSGSRLTALTVDHGLRAGSAAEGGQVAIWAQAAGVEHVVLPWLGAKPKAAVQARARQARYDLLTQWCRTAGVLHLVLAHQADDQRETVAMRRARVGAGRVDTPGLAGMSTIVPRDGVRLLRPLLSVSRADIAVYLRAIGQPAIEDPSNAMDAFERVRWRKGHLGDLPARAEIRAAGVVRQETELAAADLLMRAAKIDPAGFAWLDPVALAKADAEPRLLAAGQLIACLGGADYRPARSALQRDLAAALDGGPIRSLGGCLIGHWQGRILVAREAAGVDLLPIRAPGAHLWDRRFMVCARQLAAPLTVAPLGERGLVELAKLTDLALILTGIPAPARAGLPACRDATGRLIRVPFTKYDPFNLQDAVIFRLLPHNSATSVGFTVA